MFQKLGYIIVNISYTHHDAPISFIKTNSTRNIFLKFTNVQTVQLKTDKFQRPINPFQGTGLFLYTLKTSYSQEV